MGRADVTPGEALWLRHASVGVLTAWIAGAFVVAYAQHAGAVQHRALLTTLAIAAAVGSVGFRELIRQATLRDTQARIFAAWSLSMMSAAVWALHLDGGVRSPLVSLLFVVLVFPSFAYPWRLVLALAGFEIAGTAVVLDLSSTAGASQKAFLLVGLALTGGMVTLAARNRGVQETAIAQLTHRLEEQAVEDPLTGCLNRRGFDRALAAEASRGTRYAAPWALLLLDIDRLKALNDSAGHAAGDAAIVRVALAMREEARRTDVVARLGGDEFAMLLPETTLSEARRLAERLQRRLALSGSSPKVTVSMGLASSSDAFPGEAEAVLRAADAGLYAAKLAGRDRLARVAPPVPIPRAVPSQRA